jgi:hypothetical protein
MADFAITVSNTLRVVGPAPSSKWGVFNWGGLWGGTDDLIFSVGKLITNSLGLSSAIYKSLTKAISNTVDLNSRMNLGSLRDENGYYYVFPDNVTDPDDRYFPTWTQSSEPSTSFTTSTDPSTSWTEV